RPVVASFDRWATGTDWVPWSDESQFKMDVIADRPRYSVGDTATVLLASPFTDAEAWVTVEREGLIEQRRIRITSGTTTLKLPITEAYAPNAFVGVVVARGRSAKPGPLDDPGRPTIRVGYAELRVTPEVKRLTVSVEPGKTEYRPGDTARVQLTVKDRSGKGQRSEVTLWAVDEGVLSLTGYKTPDPLDLLYQPRGLGLRLASNLTTVAPQVPEGEKGGRAPGGGGGQGESDILRSRFKTTAFFLGSVVTDSAGKATAKSKLPDNLTTFRVMAVAVTDADRFGKGESPLLVTRPLIARPALPRFARPGDRFTAGVVVNQRAGGTPTVKVSAEAMGSELSGKAEQQAVLEAGRGKEMRFDFRQPEHTDRDSATFRFRVSGAGDADAVERSIALQAAIKPLAVTEAGMVHDSATITFQLPADLDPAASKLVLSLGSSPLSVIRGLDEQLRVYPYQCTEQVSSAAAPISALLKSQKALTGLPLLKGDPAAELARAVAILSGRQRPDGGIGYWSASDWTTPWLSAYAGLALLDARAAGASVDDSVLARLRRYLTDGLRKDVEIQAPVIGWYEQYRLKLGDRVAAADYLSRLGKPDLPAENELLRQAAQLSWEDRTRLAEILARRGAVKAARGLLVPIWSSVRIEGRRAVLPDSALLVHHYFESKVRPIARLLTATLAVDSANALIGPLVESLVQRGRAGNGWGWWNTQDYASAVSGLARFAEYTRGAAVRAVRLTSGGKTLLSGTGGQSAQDSSIALTGLLGSEKDGTRSLALSVTAGSGSSAPVYFYLTVLQIPRERPVKPDDAGIQVERWYERYDDGKPVTSVKEGELVRVRLRITALADRDFVVVDDALPAGLEAVDLSLHTEGSLPGPGSRTGSDQDRQDGQDGQEGSTDRWYYGYWEAGWWSPFEHRELRDDRVIYFATVLWKGRYSMSYVARATTPGVFVRPPAQAEEMYNPAVHGRSDGGVFTVTKK
ncbi:MAG: alpha-2-macroglobulin family protein, partial [Gemmatimonadota bacterium]